MIKMEDVANAIVAFRDRAREFFGQIPRVDMLDHGFVKMIDLWGSDRAIVEAARESTDKGFLGWEPGQCPFCEGEGFVNVGNTRDPDTCEDTVECPACVGKGRHRGDAKLLRYLYQNKHATPFEMAGAIFQIQAPIFVFREWHRHRTQCLAGDTMIHFQRPDNGRVYKMPIREVWRKWQPTTRSDRPGRQANALGSRDRIAKMSLRCVDEETKSVVLTRVVDVIRSDVKQLFSLTTVGGKTIRASAYHKFFTNRGWMRLQDAVSSGAMVAVESTAKKLSESWEYDLIDTAKEAWRPVVGWEDFMKCQTWVVCVERGSRQRNDRLSMRRAIQSFR